MNKFLALCLAFHPIQALQLCTRCSGSFTVTCNPDKITYELKAHKGQESKRKQSPSVCRSVVPFAFSKAWSKGTADTTTTHHVQEKGTYGRDWYCHGPGLSAWKRQATHEPLFISPYAVRSPERERAAGGCNMHVTGILFLHADGFVTAAKRPFQLKKAPFSHDIFSPNSQQGYLNDHSPSFNCFCRILKNGGAPKNY